MQRQFRKSYTSGVATEKYIFIRVKNEANGFFFVCVSANSREEITNNEYLENTRFADRVLDELCESLTLQCLNDERI